MNFKVANGTIDPEQQKTPMREIVAAGFLLLGPLMLIGGAMVIWGWGGVLFVVGVVLTALGVTMSISKTGKG